MIAEPGIYEMMAAEYHADPCVHLSLSSSLVTTILSSTPKHAWQAHPRLGGQSKASTPAMDLGSVAHEIVLGKGGGFLVSPYDAYTTKDARAWKAETIEAGKTPIKAKDYDAALQIAASVRKILDATPGAERAFLEGKAELVGVWQDIGGPWCRIMLDWTDVDRGFDIYDLKVTGKGLSDDALNRWISADLDARAAFYVRGIEQIYPGSHARFTWVFAEDEAPFEARVFEMDNVTRGMGDRRAAMAIEIWRRCLAANDWPGYPRKIQRPDYPAWAESRRMAREQVDDAALDMQVMTHLVERPAKTLLGAC